VLIENFVTFFYDISECHILTSRLISGIYIGINGYTGKFLVCVCMDK